MNKGFTNEQVRALAKFSYLELGDITKLDVTNSLLHPTTYKDISPGLQLVDFMRRPENFWFTCKWLLNIELFPFQVTVLEELWNRHRPMLIAGRGSSKTYTLALYAVLRALFHQGCKIVVVGSAFRQSKLLFEFMQKFWRDAPILQQICGDKKFEGIKSNVDRYSFYIGSSEIIGIPIGTGDKIRGLRANYIISDEFASMNPEIFEVVIRGFGSTSSNPVEKSKKYSEMLTLREYGLLEEAAAVESDLGMGNQVIISGTAYYTTNHFYEYWVRYKKIIESAGDVDKLADALGGYDKMIDGFDWKNYSIIRLPYNLLPKGYMDNAMVADAKASNSKSIFLMEYCAVFPKDSDGFFKFSLLQSCTTNEPITIEGGHSVQFGAAISGQRNLQYVYAIDPASESDNFSIVILECHPTHRRTVYCWTARKKETKEKLRKESGRSDTSFYNYCARKIRNLMKIFPTSHIAVDSQGGGYAVIEALCESLGLEAGEQPLWPYTCEQVNDPFWWEDAKKPTDQEKGNHIIHQINFADTKLIAEANHFLKRDLEQKRILFPQFDAIALEEAVTKDETELRMDDNLEDCMQEIEKLKDELTTIVHTQTPKGVDQWDTPEILVGGQTKKKKRMRKDRYSALLMANLIAHVIEHQLSGLQHEFVGGYVGQKTDFDKQLVKGELYVGPHDIINKMGGTTYGRGFSRRF